MAVCDQGHSDTYKKVVCVIVRYNIFWPGHILNRKTLIYRHPVECTANSICPANVSGFWECQDFPVAREV